MRQTVFTAILAALLLGAGYMWLRYVRPEPVAGLAQPTESAIAERIGQYRHLKSLKPDTGILSDPLFRALQRPVPPPPPGTPPARPPQGRTNPFAPSE